MIISHTHTSRIAIIGGGASGTMLAANLLRVLEPHIGIVLIEKRNEIGRGIAYSTDDPSHLLNVRAGNMSAYADRPDHFYEWLQIHGPQHGIGCPTRFCFAPRHVYGEYIGGLLRDRAKSGRLTIVQDECVEITPTATGVTLALKSTGTLKAACAVLATGNEQRPPILAQRGDNPWRTGVLDQIDAAAPVLIVGTGLTMVDMVLSLYRRGHRGPVIAVSRRGMLPHPHRVISSLQIPRAEVPFGAPISALMRWLRVMARIATEKGADWRSVIDALRPYTQDLWQAMSLDQRRRFRRHARPWWEVCRHRMAPQIADLIENLRSEGRLRVLAGRVVAAEPDAERTKVTLLNRGGRKTEIISVAAILECTGLPDDPRHSNNPAIRSLLAAGRIRPGPLAIGLDIADDCALIGADGVASPCLFAVGPLTRGVLWESIAVPDIRNQCANLADLLAQRFSGPIWPEEFAIEPEARSWVPPEVTPFFHPGSNTISYVVKDPNSPSCAVVDSALDFDYSSGRIGYTSADAIIGFIRAHGLNLEWLIESHVHADHLSAAPYIQKTLGGQIGIGTNVTVVQQVFGKIFNEGSEFQRDGSQFDRLFADGESYTIGTMAARAMHTPGHTPACMTHIIGDAAFVGDTLFMPDSGTARADFPGGDARELYRSIKRVLDLPPSTRLFMCHDYGTNGRETRWETTVADERANNVHIHDGVPEDQFVAMRIARDATLGMPRLIIPSVQVNIRGGKLPDPATGDRRFLKLPLNAL